MTDDKQRATFTAPSKSQLLKITGAALGVAVLLLVLVILPAEYGIDYTGFGRATGLTTLAQSSAGTSQASADQSAAQTSQADTGADAGTGDGGEETLPWRKGGPPPLEGIDDYSRNHDTPHKTKTVKVKLAAGEEVEYKAILNKGEPLLFSWSIPEGNIYYEFHGEPTEGEWPKGFYMSYSMGKTGTQNGSFVAPFTGRHGWYWVNYNDEPVTIRLTFAGYFVSAKEVYRAQR